MPLNVTATQLPLVLRVSEVAQLLQIARGKAYELVASGDIPSIRIGRTVRVPSDELLNWIEAKKAAA